MQHLEVSCAVRPIVAVRRQMVKVHVVGHLLDLVGEILHRKAGSESLVHRKRQRIGGRNKTNTPIPLPLDISRRQ